MHTLEHGRVIIWFKPNLPAEDRGKLKALFDEDDFHLVLTPNETDMPYAVAATAWNAEPDGRSAPAGSWAARRFNDKIIDALRAFKDEHRDRGPETSTSQQPPRAGLAGGQHQGVVAARRDQLHRCRQPELGRRRRAAPAPASRAR